MFTTLSRVIKYGWKGFRRNGWLSTAAIAIVFLVLIGFGGLLLFNRLANLVLLEIQDKIDISVYFKIDAPEDEILKIQRSLEGLGEVKNVEYVSRDQALEIFKAQHSDDETISKALEQLEDNPLAASLNIKARELGDYRSIDAFLQKDSFSAIVSKVSYADNQTIITRMEKIKSTVEWGGWALVAVITLITGLIIFNTIRLAIYSSREELGIMRLVGGSNFFIRGPYVFEGILYGLIGGILSVGVITLATYYISPYLKYFLIGISGWSYYASHFWGFAFSIILFGIVLGVVSSYFAVKRYLKI